MGGVVADTTMTDTMNLRRLASTIRKKGYVNIPETKILLQISKELGIVDWTQDMIKKEAGLEEMLAFHMGDSTGGENE